MGMRTERDSLGEMQVPEEALYGAQTRRAELNFPVSGWRLPRAFLRALGLIKACCAGVNADLARLDPALAEAIRAAAREVAEGRLDDQFVVDVFQTGSGTSTNMNANEVIANRAIQALGGEVGSKSPVHPNDHVNLGQSSNDVIPTALHVAAVDLISNKLLPALALVEETLRRKAEMFDSILKIGRTHLQDATPVRLGQVFGGYAAQVRQAIALMEMQLPALGALPLGGTAVGTGVNTHPEFGARVAKALAAETGLPLAEADNHMAAQASQDGAVAAMAAVKAAALALGKIANDIRHLASGPRCGLGELRLPAVQPGSSIMPGKVNPVICESVLQVSAHAVGADAAVSHGAAILSHFELSAALPLMAHHLLESIRLLANVSRTFAVQCLQDLEADEEHCAALVEQSLALATPLAPRIGYDAAAEIAKEAFRSGRTVRQVAEERQALPPDDLAAALDPRRMTEPDEA